MTNTALLEEFINKSGYKKSYLAKAIGRTAYCLAKKIRNENEFTAREIDILCTLLNITKAEDKEAVFFAK